MPLLLSSVLPRGFFYAHWISKLITIFSRTRFSRIRRDSPRRFIRFPFFFVRISFVRGFISRAFAFVTISVLKKNFFTTISVHTGGTEICGFRSTSLEERRKIYKIIARPVASSAFVVIIKMKNVRNNENKTKNKSYTKFFWRLRFLICVKTRMKK